MTHIQQRRDQAAIWVSENPILFDGESGHESDTGREKMGDGVTAWNDLPYKFGVDSVAGKTGEVELVVGDVSGAAPLAGPALTGNPTAPTPATGDNDTSIATTAYVKAQGYATTTYVEEQGYATTANPTFTGNPTAPTPSVDDNDTSIATTAFVQRESKANILEAGSWISQTPDFPNLPAVGISRYVRIGNTVHLRAYVEKVSGVVGSNFWMVLPFEISPAWALSGVLESSVRAAVSGGTYVSGFASIRTPTTVYFSSTYPASSAWGTSTPFAWANGDTLTVGLTYEAKPL